MRPNLIKDKSLQFAIKTIDFCNYLDNHKQYVISKQLKKSGTSIGAQIFESENAESRADFIHKLSIAQKEANETIYWIKIVEKLKIIDKFIFEEYENSACEIKAIITSILKKLKTK